jgi:hypothetical protein
VQVCRHTCCFGCAHVMESKKGHLRLHTPNTVLLQQPAQLLTQQPAWSGSCVLFTCQMACRMLQCCLGHRAGLCCGTLVLLAGKRQHFVRAVGGCAGIRCRWGVVWATAPLSHMVVCLCRPRYLGWRSVLEREDAAACLADVLRQAWPGTVHCVLIAMRVGPVVWWWWCDRSNVASRMCR